MNQISLNEVEKELKDDAKVYLYFAKEFEGDSIKKEKNSSANSSCARNPKEDSSPSEVEKTELDCLLQKYKDIFREKLPEELPSKRVIDHVIDTSDHNPVNKNAYQLFV